jgi:hypothetical protein
MTATATHNNVCVLIPNSPLARGPSAAPFRSRYWRASP